MKFDDDIGARIFEFNQNKIYLRNYLNENPDASDFARVRLDLEQFGTGLTKTNYDKIKRQYIIVNPDEKRFLKLFPFLFNKLYK